MSDLPEVGSNFGYRFEPSCAADQSCHRRLTVAMRGAATTELFDPDKVECRVATSRGAGLEGLV